ncbi:MAG: FHA domain-containing protein [Gemmataceae bacterium]
MDVKLVVLSGKHKDREIPLPPTMFLIGRDRNCHLRLKSPVVSRRHCAIATWAGKVCVRDLNSVNGTYVNGSRIKGEMRVGDGDRLQVGRLLLAFRVVEAQPQNLERPLPGSLEWLSVEAEDGAGSPEATERTLFDPLKPGSSESVIAGAYLEDYMKKRR